ncbi:hypothetical protein QSV08_09925 [Maribacter sp. BPC-D8]|uniref:hypothetical protein n=1 Tax=Maribacter sp. BPC-D8 TaxID=3053613 RepID=UPI002B485B10|nr:hypothetical protein [Maribacter sp. BPC-D8]WRI31554.1 hypothetical protein QSV08_09925 [Maribacter sp. BPC-D8]
MTRIYFKKENLILWYILFAMGIAVLIFGWLLIEYFAWQAILILSIAIYKIISISKKPITPVLELNDEGITLLGLNDQPFYPFVNINKIFLDSCTLNGYINLKTPNKKVILDAVAISMKDQREIADFVNQRI